VKENSVVTENRTKTNKWNDDAMHEMTVDHVLGMRLFIFENMIVAGGSNDDD